MYNKNIRLQKNNQNIKQPVVLEIGEFSTKAGYSGDEKPCYLKPTVYLKKGSNIL